ncbi:tyrosine-type recombinase/integrase [Halobellus marinus]|uniref:tyrosine-type recombinase/integrase n=1 Tax=Halobellus marinus TaxID=3075123 RepID=UPI0028B1FC25|nr:phage integrase SAM-like domain-containing protein [Halobellus sp. DFY28]
MSSSGNGQGHTDGQDDRPVEIADVVEDYLTDKGKGAEGKSGTYRRDAKRELDRFLTFLEDERPRSPTTFEELTIRDIRQYARHLATQDWTESTKQNYYAHISAFCGWAVREGYLDENPALKSRAKEPLPEDDGRKTERQQAWSPEQRTALLEYVDEQAHEAIDEVGENRYEAIKACRDRALVYLLCFSGVRGAEVLAMSPTPGAVATVSGGRTFPSRTTQSPSSGRRVNGAIGLSHRLRSRHSNASGQY